MSPVLCLDIRGLGGFGAHETTFPLLDDDFSSPSTNVFSSFGLILRSGSEEQLEPAEQCEARPGWFLPLWGAKYGGQRNRNGRRFSKTTFKHYSYQSNTYHTVEMRTSR